MATIDNLTLEITANTDKAVDNLTKLASALSTLKTATKGFSPSSMNKTASAIVTIKDACNGISLASVKRIERLGDALNRISMFSPNTLKSVGKALNSFSNPVIDSMKKETSKAYPTETKQAVDSGTKQVQSATAEVIAPVAEKAKESESALGSLMGIINKIKGSKILSILGGLGKGIKKLLSPLTFFIKALARIAFYRFIRGIIKGITEGIKVGIQNLALYSKAMEELDAHSANNVMSRYASEFLYFKNAIATAIMPVLRAFIPLVETAINRVIDFINVLSQIGSAIFGTQYTKAKYFWVDYADSLDKSAGSAKKLHHQLAQFDELNNLTDSQKGGSGTALEDASQMFEEAVISSKIKEFVDKVKNSLKEIKTALDTWFAPFRERWNKFKEDFQNKVLPHLQKTWENLKRIWAVLKPILNSFMTGLLKNFGLDLEDISAILEKLSIGTEIFTGWLARMFEKIDIDKAKKFAERLGEIFYWIVTSNLRIGTIEWTNANAGLHKVLDKVKQGIEKVDYALGYLMTGFTETKKATDICKEGMGLWADSLSYLKDKLKETYDKIINFKNVTLPNSISLFFSNFKATLDNVVNALKNVYDWLRNLATMVITIPINVTTNISGSIANLGSNLANAVNDVFDTIETAIDTKKAKKATTSVASAGIGALAGLTKRASGGYVPKGDLFVANEQGAEMVGSVNGQTAVANNQMITQAIAEATYRAMSRALSENENSVNVTVEGDADRMFKVFTQKQREHSRMTGLAY